jgi:hypothetical protein
MPYDWESLSQCTLERLRKIRVLRVISHRECQLGTVGRGGIQVCDERRVPVGRSDIDLLLKKDQRSINCGKYTVHAASYVDVES